MEKIFDYLIVGAGPAGLQLGYFLEKAKRDYLILEAGDSPGSFFKIFPRHRQLISSNKLYTGYDDPEINLRWDWNSLLSDSEELVFKNYSDRYFPPAEMMVRYLTDYANHYQLKIDYSVKVTRVAKNGEFRLETASGALYHCRRLIIATGFTQPYIPPIPGIELAENYTTMTVEPAAFKNQRVLIIGKGNSGFETADNLIETTALIHIASPNPIAMAWKTHFVGNLRAVNNNLLDTYQLKSQNAVIDATIERIDPRAGKYAVTFSYTHAQGEGEELIYDRILVCTGFKLDASIFDESCRPALMLNDRFPCLTSAWEATNIPDLYFQGTLTQGRDWKKATSGFIHGFRYNARVLHRIFEVKYHGGSWPQTALSPTPAALTEAVIRRTNQSSALWQQFGFLGDVIVLPDGAGAACYYEELPIAWVHDQALGKNAHYYLIDLEFGKTLGDPFQIERYPDPTKAERSTFLHPVIRHFSGPTLIAEHHILEDLYGEWLKEDVHIRPLLNFFQRQLGEASSPTTPKRAVARPMLELT